MHCALAMCDMHCDHRLMSFGHLHKDLKDLKDLNDLLMVLHEEATRSRAG